jgi:hypothetical protein
MRITLIISVTALIVAIIVMYPTYKCMNQLNADGSEAGFMCITGK